MVVDPQHEYWNEAERADQDNYDRKIKKNWSIGLNKKYSSPL